MSDKAMKLERDQLYRLTMIKYLVYHAVEESRRAEPICYTSLLLFHDAIELFLQLSAEVYSINPQKIDNFMKYFERINEKIAPNQLYLKEPIRRLKNARVNFKHKGFPPSPKDIVSYRTNTMSFLERNSQLLFGLKFSDISLSELLINSAQKEKILLVENLLNQNKLKEALKESAITFRMIINDFLKDENFSWGNKAFSTPLDLMLLDYNTEGLAYGGSTYLDPQMGKVQKILYSLIERINIIGLGIDYLKYAKFDSIVPRVTRTDSGWLVMEPDDKITEVSKDICLFCVNFLIESALQLQKFGNFM